MTKKEQFIIRIPLEINVSGFSAEKDIHYYIKNQEKFVDMECSEWLVTTWREKIPPTAEELLESHGRIITMTYSRDVAGVKDFKEREYAKGATTSL